MSEDNILNLELGEGEAEEENGVGAPNLVESADELGFDEEYGFSQLSERLQPASREAEEAPGEAAANSAELVSAVAQNVQQMISSRLAPVRAGLQHLTASIHQIEEELALGSSSPSQLVGSELNGLLGLFTREAESSAARTRDYFEQILEEERRSAALRLEEEVEATRQILTQEAESRLTELTTQLEASRQALALAVISAEKAATPTAATSQDAFTSLRMAVEEINSQRSQADTLSALIRNAALFAPRIAFFVVKAGVANGWKACGFDNGLNDESVKSLAVQVQESTTIGRALLSFETVRGSLEATELGQFGTPAPVAMVAIPLVVRGRAAAVLYADSGLDGEESINLAALETIMRVGSMGIELLPTRRAEPVPASPRGTTPLPRPTQSTTSAPVVSPPPAGVTSTPSPAPVTPIVAPVMTVQATVSGSQPVSPRTDFSPFSTRELKPVAPEPSASEQLATEPDNQEPARSELITASPEFHPELPVHGQSTPVVSTDAVHDAASKHLTSDEQTDAEFKNFTVETEFAPTATGELPRLPETPARITKPVPGDPVSDSPVVTSRPAPPPLPAPTESEQRAHNDARRFARLLVSEIKLYNAAKVSEGRKNFNLYELLTEEIDRSRKVYDKRVSPAVATKFDYFYDELLQTLAEGDSAKLGQGCPGPVIR